MKDGRLLWDGVQVCKKWHGYGGRSGSTPAEARSSARALAATAAAVASVAAACARCMRPSASAAAPRAAANWAVRVGTEAAAAASADSATCCVLASLLFRQTRLDDVSQLCTV